MGNTVGVGLCSKHHPPPRGRTVKSRVVKRAGAHLKYTYIIDSKRLQVDRLKTLGQVHYTKHRQMSEILLGWGYVRRPPRAEPEKPGRSKGRAYIFNIYIFDSKRFQVDRLKPLGQAHYTKSLTILLTSDGRTDAGRTDGHHLELKVVLIPMDTISGENRKCTHGQGKTLWPSDYSQAGHKKTNV